MFVGPPSTLHAGIRSRVFSFSRQTSTLLVHAAEEGQLLVSYQPAQEHRQVFLHDHYKGDYSEGFLQC